MKIIYFLTAGFVFFTGLAKAQHTNCDTEYLGKFKVIHEKDTTEALLLRSSLCESRNLAIIDRENYSRNCFKYSDAVDFENCSTTVDSLLWGYFFVNKYKFDTARFKTSKPYTNKDKRNPKYFYFAGFNLKSIRWSVKFTMQNDKIIYMCLYKDPDIPRDPLYSPGSIIFSRLFGNEK